MEKIDKSIAIIGGGPAGAWAAFLLSSRFKSVFLLEKKSSTFRKVCGEYLCPAGVKLLQGYQASDLFQGFQPLEGMTIFSPAGRGIKGFFPNKELGISLNREIFDARLRKRAEDNGSILCMGQMLLSLTRIDGQWQVETEQGMKISVDLIIGADGIKSQTARLLGIEEKKSAWGKQYDKKVAIHSLLNVKTHERFGRMHILKEGMYVGIDPVNQTELNYSLVIDSSLLKNVKSLDLFLRNVHEENPELERLYPINQMQEIRTLSPLTFKPELISGENFALIGDASGFIDPLTGEGIYNALLSATLLSEALLKSGENLSLGLREYRQLRKKSLQEKERTNRFFQWLIHFPKLCELIAIFLKAPKRADIFMGIIGNLYGPLKGLRLLIGLSSTSK